jgi:glycosyltransferase involved in cell wall biosynthesis
VWGFIDLHLRFISNLKCFQTFFIQQDLSGEATLKSFEVDVLIPCFNEEVSVGHTIKEIQRVLPEARILVVDNNSTDATSSVAKSLGVEVVFERRRGKGFAVARGFNEIRDQCQVVCILDGDTTYSVAELNQAVEIVRLQNVDMVVGTRIDSTPKKSAYPKMHVFGNWTFKVINRLAIDLKVDDPLSGYRVLSRRFVNSFTGGATQFEIEAELNAHARTLSCEVVNLEVSYGSRPEGSNSKLRTITDGISILKMYIRSFYRIRPFFAFSLSSTIPLVIGVALLWRAFSVYLQTKEVPNFPSLIVGVGLLGFAMNLFIGGLILARIRSIQISLIKDRYNRK